MQHTEVFSTYFALSKEQAEFVDKIIEKMNETGILDTVEWKKPAKILVDAE